MWSFDENPKDSFDNIILTVNLIERLDNKDQENLVFSQKHTLLYSNRMMCFYQPIIFFEDYFLKLDAVFYCFVKGVGFSKEIESLIIKDE